MTKLLLALFSVFGAGALPLYAEDVFTSCGPGYVLVEHAKIDGVKAKECQKLWCRDLETGRSMGNGKSAAVGYVSTPEPVQLCASNGAGKETCIDCFGERKWCSGEVRGEWNSEYGAYTRRGEDNATYFSYLRGGCYAWRLEKPDCPSGQTAILKDDKWVCAIAAESGGGERASAVRRTGSVRRILH